MTVISDPHVVMIRPVVPQTPRGVRRVPASGHALGTPAAVPHLRACRLLRLVADEARAAARPYDRTSHRPVVRARRGLALVLRRRNLRLSGAEPAANHHVPTATLRGSTDDRRGDDAERLP